MVCIVKEQELRNIHKSYGQAMASQVKHKIYLISILATHRSMEPAIIA